MTPDIRAAVPEDLDAIRWIARAAYAIYLARIGREPAPMVADFAASIAAGELWVAGMPVAGFVVAYPRGDHWHLENVAVAPSAQGAGLGGALIAHVEATAPGPGGRAVGPAPTGSTAWPRARGPGRGPVRGWRWGRPQAGWPRLAPTATASGFCR